MSALAVRHRRDQPRPGVPRRRRPAGAWPRRPSTRSATAAATSTRPAPASPSCAQAIAAHQRPALRPRPRPRHRGAGHRRRHRGDRRRDAGAGRRRATRSSRSSRSTTPTPRDDRDGAGHAASASRCDPPDFRLDVDALRAAVTDRTTRPAAQLPAQPDRHGAHPRRARRRRARWPSSTTCWSVTDEVYEHLAFDGAARPARHPPRHGRAHGVDLQRGQDVLVHRLEDRLGDRAGRPGARRAHGQAVPHLRQRRARSSPPSRTPSTTRCRGCDEACRESLANGATCSCDGLAAARARRPTDRDGTYFVTTDVRPLGWDDGLAFCRALPERAGVVAIPCSVFYDDQAQPSAHPGALGVQQAGARPRRGGPPPCQCRSRRPEGRLAPGEPWWHRRAGGLGPVPQVGHHVVVAAGGDQVLQLVRVLPVVVQLPPLSP